MRYFSLIFAICMIAGSAVALAGSDWVADMHDCTEMSDKVTAEGEVAPANTPHECPEGGCCDGLCLCKASGANVMATMPDLLKDLGETLPMNVLPEAVDALVPVLHLLFDPPPRSED